MRTSAEPLFRNRFEAGLKLARRLQPVVTDANALILALPRGGVPVGFEVAELLHAELDVLLVRKLGVPGHEELAMGAIASGGIRVINHALVTELGLSSAVIDRVTASEHEEIARRESLYREGRPAAGIAGRLTILVDDGLATGATMFAAALAARERKPNRLVVGVPVASREAYADIRRAADEVVCLQTPEPFYSVGTWYEEFLPTSDDEVQQLLERAARKELM